MCSGMVCRSAPWCWIRCVRRKGCCDTFVESYVIPGTRLKGRVSGDSSQVGAGNHPRSRDLRNHEHGRRHNQSDGCWCVAVETDEGEEEAQLWLVWFCNAPEGKEKAIMSFSHVNVCVYVCGCMRVCTRVWCVWCVFVCVPCHWCWVGAEWAGIGSPSQVEHTG